MASFSVTITSSDSIWSKKEITLNSGTLMLSLAFLPHLGFVTLQVENVTLYLATSQENVLGILIVRTPRSQWNLCDSHKCRKARPSVLGRKVTSWLLFPHSLTPQDIQCKLQKNYKFLVNLSFALQKMLLCSWFLIYITLEFLYHLEILVFQLITVITRIQETSCS